MNKKQKYIPITLSFTNAETYRKEYITLLLENKNFSTIKYNDSLELYVERIIVAYFENYKIDPLDLIVKTRSVYYTYKNRYRYTEDREQLIINYRDLYEQSDITSIY